MMTLEAMGSGGDTVVGFTVRSVPRVHHIQGLGSSARQPHTLFPDTRRRLYYSTQYIVT